MSNCITVTKSVQRGNALHKYFELYEKNPCSRSIQCDTNIYVDMSSFGGGMTRKIVFTGGGTGGHVTPAIAISEGLREVYPEVAFRYVGKKGKVEEGMVPKEWAAYGAKEKEVQFVSTTSGSLKSPKVLFQLGLGFVQAAAFLLRFRPDAVVATGGYVSAPIVFATGLLKKIGLLKKKMLLEANAELEE